MKRSTKIVLITSACLIFGGILIAGISGAVGGTRQFKELVDKQALNFDLPGGNSQLKLTTEGLYFTNEDDEEQESARPFDEPETAKEGEGKVPATDSSEIRNIEMELGAGEIEIKKSENGTFHVEEGENMLVESDFDHETLKIRTKVQSEIQILGFHVGNVDPVGKVVIYLPDQMYEEITLDMGAGEFGGEIPECTKLSVRLGAGECDFEYIKADEVELEVGAGECKIGMLEARELDADIAMGEFSAKALVGEDLDAQVGMGEIAMKIVGEETDYDYDVDVGAGEVRIGSRTYSGVGSGGKQDNGLDRKIDVECGMGQATLTFVKE